MSLLRSWLRQTFLSVSLCFILQPSSFSHSSAATVRTLDGNTYTGDVRLDTGGLILVTPAEGGSPKKIDLSEVLHATFGNTAAATAITASSKTPAALAPYHTENSQIPTPWTTTDIGALSEKGYASFTNEGQVFSIKSAGGNIGAADDDAFCFVNQPVTGDFDLIARTTTVGDPKVTQGLMLRAGSEPGATYVAIFYVAGDIRFFKRTRTNQATQAGTVGAARSPLPVTMRLTRRADTITAAWSRDGNTWQSIGSETLPMRPGALAGVACCGRGKQLLGAHVTNLQLAKIAPASTATPEVEITAPQPIKEGLTFRSGTHLAAAQIEKADDASLTFTKGDRKATLSLASVARITYRELSPEMANKIPEQRTGVLLKEGDFVEGTFKGLLKGRIELSSVLFGLAKFEPREKAVALIVNDLDPATRPKLILRTRDGSTYVAKNFAPEKDTLIIEDPLAGQFTINRWEVTEISAGPGRLESLTLLKPEKIDPPTRDNSPSLSIDSTGLGLPMTLAGSVPCQHGLTITAGSTVSWNLAKEYRTFTFKCGVPQGILPTAPIRFIVLADGKELYKSPPQTSLNDPISNSLSIKGVTTLTLKVESTLPTPGLWADPALVK